MHTPGMLLSLCSSPRCLPCGFAISSWCVPCSTTLPRDITTMESAWRTVLSRWATITTVLLPLPLVLLARCVTLPGEPSALLQVSQVPARFWRARLTAASLAESRAEVASSSNRIYTSNSNQQ